ncbi:MAG TPA: hypothetical protein VI172_15720, partial [Candidatus Dormibacteraeota bacterium]
MSTARRIESSDSSLAARELSFLVRLAQAAASTQSSDELLELIIRETTSALGTNVCSLYLAAPPGQELLLTATNGLNENMIGKVRMRQATELYLKLPGHELGDLPAQNVSWLVHEAAP